MAQRYIYFDKIGSGSEDSEEKFASSGVELTEETAKHKYALNAAQQDEWFGVIRVNLEENRPDGYLQISPSANGAILHKLDMYGSISATYLWGEYYDPEDGAFYDGQEDKLFLNLMKWYVYPETGRHYSRSESIATVNMEFQPDGFAKEDKIIYGENDETPTVETKEFINVDVTINWFAIPEFGMWENFFNPEANEGASAPETKTFSPTYQHVRNKTLNVGEK